MVPLKRDYKKRLSLYWEYAAFALQYNNWAPGQPNGSVRDDGFGNEACMALLDDGISQWNDEACSSRRQLVCEDLPVPNINFVRNANPNVNIP